MIRSLMKVKLLLSAILLLLLIAEALYAFRVEPPVAVPDAANQSAPPVAVASLAIFDPHSYLLADSHDFTERPLFAASRRLATKPEAGQNSVEVSQIADWSLTGIFRTGQTAYAIMVKKNQPQNRIKVSEKQTVAGWNLKLIANDHVVLELNGQERIVELRQVKPQASISKITE